ncbi:MAG TPA: hypothetical protein VKB72_13985, partial [Steroidobacteraceae bacterium]|nr:hypothetical protein [Steroidobacteraceae bacterium]
GARALHRRHDAAGRVSRVHVQLSGGCHCGNLRLQVGLTGEPGQYSPRACDCDFCRKHGAAWLSDPKGSLRISVRNARELGKYAQGSGTAELLLCRHCGVLVGACLTGAGGRLYGAVNAQAVECATPFAAAQSVSPQHLSADEKVQRWQQLWFSDVTIIAGDAGGVGVGATRA